jgi:hypothetical protein
MESVRFATTSTDLCAELICSGIIDIAKLRHCETLPDHDSIDMKEQVDVTLKFPLGDIFKGTLENGKATGPGYYKNRHITYEGDFSEGCFEGEGTLTFASGFQFKGKFKNGAADLDNDPIVKIDKVWNDRGEIFTRQGDYYSGSLKNDKPHGHGRFFSSNGMELNGNFENGEFKKGRLLLDWDHQHTGEYRGTKFHGKGFTHWGRETIDGFWEDGEFLYGRIESREGRDIIHNPDETPFEEKEVLSCDVPKIDGFLYGKGTLILQGGIHYEGNFVDNHLEGEGFLDTPIYTYEGEFLHNQFHGNGTLTYKKSGLMIHGKFENGQACEKKYTFTNDRTVEKDPDLERTLEPIKTFRDGIYNSYHRTFEGNLDSEGVPHFGILRNIKGLGRGKYIGEVVGEMRHGKGTLYDSKDEMLFEGTFVDDQYEKGTLRGRGAFQNWTFVGYFKDDRPSNGKKVYADGTTYAGTFIPSDKYEENVISTGKVIGPNGVTFEGNFIDGQQSEGTLIVPGKYTFKGLLWKKGTLTYVDGTTHEGEFDCYGRLVKGKKTFPDRHTEEGEFNSFDQLKNGKIVAENGSFYEGGLMHGKFFGTGILKLKDRSYEGGFLHGRYSGDGVLQWDNNRYKCGYKGGFMHGKFNGEGSLQLQHERYEGEFLHGSLISGTLTKGDDTTSTKTFFKEFNLGTKLLKEDALFFNYMDLS